MHSRYHLTTQAAGSTFISEIVGGFAELAAHGLASHVFVQPGTWSDSINFDTPGKLHTWRGALLRTFATVSECYAFAYSLPRSQLDPLGVCQITLSDGVSDPAIRAFWRTALRPGHATVFLVHTAHLQTPSPLDWFLDLVAQARADGLVRVLASSEEVFFAKNQ